MSTRLNIRFFVCSIFHVSTNNHVVLFIYEFLFTKMCFVYSQRLLRCHSNFFPLSSKPESALPTISHACLLLFSFFWLTGGGNINDNECMAMFTMFSCILNEEYTQFTVFSAIVINHCFLFDCDFNSNIKPRVIKTD